MWFDYSTSRSLLAHACSPIQTLWILSIAGMVSRSGRQLETLMLSDVPRRTKSSSSTLLARYVFCFVAVVTSYVVSELKFEDIRNLCCDFLQSGMLSLYSKMVGRQHVLTLTQHTYTHPIADMIAPAVSRQGSPCIQHRTGHVRKRMWIGQAHVLVGP